MRVHRALMLSSKNFLNIRYNGTKAAQPKRKEMDLAAMIQLWKIVYAPAIKNG
jgi:hypothetical protein